MSAVREVKYLRELHHPNIIEVRVFSRVHWQTSFDDRHSTLLRDDTMTLNDGLVLFSLFFFFKAPGRIFLKDESEPCT
jgi:hypothetical protein